MRFIPWVQVSTHSTQFYAQTEIERPRVIWRSCRSKRSKEAVARDLTLGLRNLYLDRTRQRLGKNDSRIRTKKLSIWWRRMNEKPVFPIATQGTRQVELEDLILQRLEQELTIIQGSLTRLAWVIASRFPTMINDMLSRKFLLLSSDPWDIFWSLAI